MLNMYIMFRDGWMRHQLRYHSLNVGVIYKGDGNQQLLEDWCNRTAANLGGRSLGVLALGESSSQAATAEITAAGIPANPTSAPEKIGNVVIINGSPRVKKFSNTNKIIQAFALGLEEAGVTHKLYSISNSSKWDEIREAFMTNDHIIIALPLYVECVPGTTKKMKQS